jgi:hypothetical protein
MKIIAHFHRRSRSAWCQFISNFQAGSVFAFDGKTPTTLRAALRSWCKNIPRRSISWIPGFLLKSIRHHPASLSRRCFSEGGSTLSLQLSAFSF